MITNSVIQDGHHASTILLKVILYLDGYLSNRILAYSDFLPNSSLVGGQL